MNLTKKIGAWICAVVMILGLNLKSEALPGGIGTFVEAATGLMLILAGQHGHVVEEVNGIPVNRRERRIARITSIIWGSALIFDATQRILGLYRNDEDSIVHNFCPTYLDNLM